LEVSTVTAVFEFMASSWIPAVLLLALTLYLRSRSDSWFAPSCFFGLFWFFFLAASLLAVDHRVPGLGTWALVALTIAVQLGSLLGENREGERKSAAEKPRLQHLTRLRVRQATVVLTLAGLAGCVYFIWSSLELFGQEFDLMSILQMAAKWTLLRYDGFIDPWPLRLAAIWVYPPALMGGMLLPLSRSRLEKMLAGLSLLPSLLLTALSGGRAAFVVGLVCWLGGYLSVRSCRVEVAGGILSVKSVVFLAAGGLALLLLYVGVNSLRHAKDATDTADLAVDFNSGQIRNYMFGMPSAFAQWFDSDAHDSVEWGALTFPGAYAVLGIRPRTLGTYNDSAQTVGLEGTNIFTMFRGLVEDFTFFGAFVFCGLWGFAGGWSYSRGCLQSGAILVLSAYYATTFFSPLICLFGFNGPMFTWLVAWLVLRRRSGSVIGRSATDSSHVCTAEPLCPTF
jgi:oligosaccharide repeat unit polymerase